MDKASPWVDCSNFLKKEAGFFSLRNDFSLIHGRMQQQQLEGTTEPKPVLASFGVA
jgi:hypothetical protein